MYGKMHTWYKRTTCKYRRYRKIYRRYIIIFFSRKVLYSLIKITKQEYENAIASSGFKCRNPISHSGKNNKYYYIVETDYENYLRFIKNKNRLGDK